MKLANSCKELPRLHDAFEVAQALGISIWGVRNLHRVGRLRGILVNRKLRFTAQAVREYIEALGGSTT